MLWLVRGGRVKIGGPGPDAAPAFRAEVRPFYIGKLPVTNLQYEAFDGDFERSPVSPGSDDPAVGVSFRDASGYSEWYARVSCKPMRLPTEVEWEYACRAEATTRYPFGETADDGEQFLWDRRNSEGRVPDLAAKSANGFGLSAMLGGVWEWTASPDRPYPLDPEAESPPVGSADPRVARGGSFRTDRDEMGCGVRLPLDPETRRDDLGFRIVRSLRIGDR